MRTVLALQHAAHEPLGNLATVLSEHGLGVEVLNLHAGDPVPRRLGKHVALVVMGGPMGVYEAEQYPFLIDEQRLIEWTVARGLPVMGICLGSQLLAAALGAEVFPSGRQEIGWFPVSLTSAAEEDPLFKGVASPLQAFHWHGDTFSPPPGAVHLASSTLTYQQAFRFGQSAYGLQFHLEVTGPIVTDFAAEASLDKATRSALLIGAELHGPALESVGRTVLNRWTQLVLSR
jgi:GMP synthase (glutamine-hydrolysing)